MSQTILSITQINEYVKTLVDRDSLLSSIALRGEISNYKLYPSGHHYFSLKDENASIKCVMFKGNALRLRFRPQNGMKVIALGRISVYPRDGAYQLYCTAMTVDGVGDLHAAFEQLKEKLGKEGLFDPAHKKPIPVFPKTIGVVTSGAGAAVHDILRVLRKRFPLSRVRLFAVSVQGAEAPPQIAGAIRYANLHGLADLLIVGRGGGSMEDLWCFNDERVAYAIYQSKIPVISAVGHEPDVTIADYVADLRAATPSNGAELAVPDQDALRQKLDQTGVHLGNILQKQLHAAKKHLELVKNHPALRDPAYAIGQRRIRLELMEKKLLSAMTGQLETKRRRHISCAAKLDAMSPLKVLSRGYAFVTDGEGKVITGIGATAPGQEISVRVLDGSIRATVNELEDKSL